MTTLHTRRAFGIYTLLICAALCALFIPGCEGPRWYASPVCISHDGQNAVTVQIVSPDIEGASHLLLLSSRNDPSSWRRVGEFHGRVVALLPAGENFNIVFEDGAVISRPWRKDEPEIIAKGKGRTRLDCAARIGKDIYAAASGDGEIRLGMLRDGSWENVAPPLTVVGSPRLLKLAEFEKSPLLIWRTEIGGRREAGLTARRLKNGDWVPFPVPIGDNTKSFFDVFKTGGNFCMVREDLASTAGQTEKILLSTFREGMWEGLSGDIPLPLELRYQSGRGLAAASDASGITIVRCDTDGVQALTSDGLDAKDWKLAATPVRRSRDETWMLFALAALLVMMLLLAGKSRRMSRHIATSLPGSDKLPAPVSVGIASPVDRALAMILDALIVMPMPLLFQHFSSDLDPLSISEESRQNLYWIWLGGLSLYAAICEGMWGRTIGKAVFSIRVRNAEHGSINWRQAVTRNLGRFIDFFPLPAIAGINMPYLIALLFVIFTRRRQRFGDVTASTVVLRHTPLAKRSIVLASASPRRKELMIATGLGFRVQASDIPEDVAPGTAPEQAALTLARLKAEAVARTLNAAEIIIAADTIIELDGEIIGKPTDRENAKEILRRLSDRSHSVITGLAMIDLATGQMIVSSDRTEIEMHELSDEDISTYVDSGETDGKAGAYAIQGTADRFIKIRRGSLSNVIGLPMELMGAMFDQLDS